MLQGKLDEAIAEFRTRTTLKPDSPRPIPTSAIALHRQGKLDEAIAEYRERTPAQARLRQGPHQPRHRPEDQGKLEEAIAEYREALGLKPDDSGPTSNLGNALRRQGKLDEAIAEFRDGAAPQARLSRGPQQPRPRPRAQGKLDEAIAEYRAALRLKPDYPEAHANIGMFSAPGANTPRPSPNSARPATWPGRRIPDSPSRSSAELTATEQQASLAARLPDVLAGKTQARRCGRILGFAQLCYEKKLHGASARLWAEAFRSQPKLADDMQAQHRYNAACAAALAGCGQGKDDPPLDDAARTRWRKQAIDWLKADLAAWSKILESGPPQARPSIAQTLQHWKADPDLAGLRDPGSLDKLPKDEQDACRTLWKEVDALLARAGGAAP